MRYHPRNQENVLCAYHPGSRIDATCRPPHGGFENVRQKLIRLAAEHLAKQLTPLILDKAKALADINQKPINHGRQS